MIGFSLFFGSDPHQGTSKHCTPAAVVRNNLSQQRRKANMVNPVNKNTQDLLGAITNILLLNYAAYSSHPKPSD